MLDDDSCPKHAGIFWFFGKATFFLFFKVDKIFQPVLDVESRQAFGSVAKKKLYPNVN